MKKTVLVLCLSALMPLAALAQSPQGEQTISFSTTTLSDIHGAMMEEAKTLRETLEKYEATPAELDLFDRQVEYLAEQANPRRKENITTDSPSALQLRWAELLQRQYSGMRGLVNQKFKESRDKYCEHERQIKEVDGLSVGISSYYPRTDDIEVSEEKAKLFCVEKRFLRE